MNAAVDWTSPQSVCQLALQQELKLDLVNGKRITEETKLRRGDAVVIKGVVLRAEYSFEA